MATKNNPGAFDCYDNAEPDEPMFVLLARDAAAPQVVEDWAKARVIGGFNTLEDEQISEALECAQNMRQWRKEHRG